MIVFAFFVFCDENLQAMLFILLWLCFVSNAATLILHRLLVSTALVIMRLQYDMPKKRKEAQAYYQKTTEQSKSQQCLQRQQTNTAHAKLM